MEENQYDRGKAPNPFVRDILIELGKTAAMIAAAWVLLRVLQLDIPRMVIAPIMAAPFYRFMMGVRNFFEYRSYIRDFHGGKPMKKEDYLLEQEAVKRMWNKKQ